MKKFLKHFAFIISMGLLCLSVVEFNPNCFFCGANEPSQIASFIAVTILILLWKNNYFTRSKS